MKPNWIINRPTDISLILNGLWLVPLLVVAYLFFPSQIEHLVAPAFILLVGGHILAPVWLILTNSEVRQSTRAKFGSLWIIAALLFVAPLALYLLSYWLRSAGDTQQLWLLPVAVTSAAYFIYNGWHFSQQNFGILQIYKRKNGSPILSRKFDFYLCLFAEFLGVGLVWFEYGLRSSFFSSYFGSMPNLGIGKWMLLGAMALLGTRLTVAVLRGEKLPLPVGLAYLHVFICPILILLNPILFAIIPRSASHWMQEIVLTSRIDQLTRKQNTARLWINMAVLIAISISYAVLHLSLRFEIPKIDVFGSIFFPTSSSHDEFLFSCLFYGSWMGANFLHFYLDRLIYKGHTHRLAEHP